MNNLLKVESKCYVGNFYNAVLRPKKCSLHTPHKTQYQTHILYKFASVATPQIFRTLSQRLTFLPSVVGRLRVATAVVVGVRVIAPLLVAS